jgi:uncharacterized protein YndB with AHSA1/START domain
MQDRPIQASATIKTTAKRAWEALTRPELIKRWFFGVDTTADWRVGGSIVHRGEWQGQAYEDKGEILVFDPPSLLAHTHWSALSGLPDEPANYQNVLWSIAERDGYVLLTITEDNLPSDQARTVSEQSWRLVLDNLKALLEEEASAATRAA